MGPTATIALPFFGAIVCGIVGLIGADAATPLVVAPTLDSDARRPGPARPGRRAAAVPCARVAHGALFALRATLADSPIGKGSERVAHLLAFSWRIRPSRGPRPLWLGVDPVAASAVVLGAAMPVGGRVFVVARHYDTGVEAVSTAVLLSSAVAMLTVAPVAPLVAPGQGAGVVRAGAVTGGGRARYRLGGKGGAAWR